VPEFTPQQDSATEWRKQDACVVAVPGSGKTTVLVERYRKLVEHHDFEMNEILAITFTEKAAANMKSKLAEKFRHNPVRLRELDSAWVSTIHGFCARLLRENAIAAGIDPAFRVLDAREAEELQVECLSAALDELVELRREDALELIGALQNPRLVNDLKGVYDAIRSAGMSIEEVRAMPSPAARAAPSRELAARLEANVKAWPFRLSPSQQESKPELLAWAPLLADADGLPFPELRQLLHKPPIKLNRIPREFKDELEKLREEELPALFGSAVDRHTARFRAIVFEILLRFHEVYNERKSGFAALDFNDLERRAIDLLAGSSDVRTKVRAKFRQIMLDEFQDVNRQQNQLVDLIRGDDVFFAVGDSNQSIYAFRHARPEILRAYEEQVAEAGKHSVGLHHNFRSRAQILNCVTELLSGADGIAARELIAGKTFEPKIAPSVEVLRAMAVAEDEEAGDDDEETESNREARWIGQRVLELRREHGHDFRDFAVLCRNGESMKPILAEFDARRIPYVCGRRQSFLVSREGRNIVALLRTAANPLDSVALVTVLRSDWIGLSDEALLRIRLLGKTVTAGLNMLAFEDSRFEGFSHDDATRLRHFAAQFRRWRADVQTVPLDVLISRMLQGCGVVWTPGSAEGDNIEAFLHLARTRGATRPLLEFVRDLESIEKAVSTESDLSDEEQGNCVQVMTAHAAKGLEFPVTIVAAMQMGTRRGSAAVSFTPEHGLGIKWRDALEKDGLKDSWAHANSETLRKREKEESNRLLYVAMTRAEQHLVLSYTRAERRRPQNWAKQIEDYFELDGQAASPQAFTVTRKGFEARVFVPDFDPLSDDLAALEIEASYVEPVPRPAPGDSFDTAVNVTALAVFGECPRKYYLERYLGWGGVRKGRFDAELDREIPEESGAELGSEVHEILAGRPGTYSDEAEQLAEVFRRSALGQRAAAASRSAREWEFIAELDGTLVRGSVDLWFEDAGELKIVDYKTDLTVRTGQYAPQLALYGLALDKAFGRKPARASLHFLRSDQVVEVPMDDAALESARGLIARLRDAQERLEFDLNEGEHCRTCPFYRGMCPAGETETKPKPNPSQTGTLPAAPGGGNPQSESPSSR
jgi:ATP-dependent exoDNAse (exonuclease V) beta subunit